MRFWGSRTTSQTSTNEVGQAKRREPTFSRVEQPVDIPVDIAAQVLVSSAPPGGEPGIETFAQYLARQFTARKGLQPGVPPEAAAIAAASDIVLAGTDYLNYRIVAILDRDAHPGREFGLDREALEAIGRACLKYSGSMSRTKMPVMIQVIEIGGGPPSREQITRLKTLKRSSPFGKVVLSGWTIDPSASSVWTNASFNGRFAGRSFIEKLLVSPRVEAKDIKPPPPMRAPVIPLVTFAMLAILLGAYACELAFPVSPPKGLDISAQTLLALGGSSRAPIAAGQWYRLLSAALLHVNPLHLLLNGVCLFIAGRVLETLIGRNWLIVVFAIGALGGSVASLLLNPPNVVSVGASGAIMALFAAIYVLSFHYDAGPVRSQLQMRALNILIPSLLPLGASIGSGHIDIGAHMGGAITGTCLGLLLLRIWPRAELLPRWRAGATAVAAVATLAFTLTLFPIIHSYHVFARVGALVPAEQLPKTDAEIAARSADLVARYPRDPRTHYFRALALVRTHDMAAAEQQLRSALADEDIIRLGLSPEFEIGARGLLAAVLLDQGKSVEAKAEAKPVCASARTTENMRAVLDKGHLCD
jgi:rhomboid protease GluP